MILPLLLLSAVVSSAYGQCQPQQCPAGFTGQYCDIVLCDARGRLHIQPPNTGYPIDLVPYKNGCNGVQRIPVDSHVRVLYAIVDGTDNTAAPTLTLTDSTGTVVPPTSVSNDSKTLLMTYRAPKPGKYFAKFSASTNCLYTAHADTDFMFDLGFVTGKGAEHNDQAQETLQEFVVSTMIGHLSFLPYPGFSRNVEVFNDNGLVSSYDWKVRYGCSYDLFAGPLVCDSTANWWFKVHGVDENGQDFMRTDIFRCTQTSNSSTTAAPTTTAGPCMNGGYFDPSIGKCLCDMGWSGQYCQTPMCFNGGTAVNGQCQCPPNYGGFNCYDAMCPTKNPVGPFNAESKTLTIMIQNSAQFRNSITRFQLYFTELIYQVQAQHPMWITNVQLVLFDATNASVWATSNDPQHLIESVLHLPDPTDNDTVCFKQLMPAFNLALPNVQQNSPVFVFLGSAPDITNASINLQALSLLESAKARVFIFGVRPAAGWCAPFNSSAMRFLYDVAEFTGGQAHLADSDRSFEGLIRMIPTTYQLSKVYERRDYDCTFVRRAWIPVDSHMTSFSVTVHGDQPTVLIYSPDGQLFPQVPLVDDRRVTVRQAIRPCPENWMQIDNQCFLGVTVPVTWQQAQEHCLFLNANLVQVFNPVLQATFDFESSGNDYWSGLNDIANEGAYEWSSNNGQPIPLGHAWLNWAPGEPSSDPDHMKNCMVVRHNSTDRRGQWAEISCNALNNYVCQANARNTDNDRLFPGLWKVEYSTQFSNTSIFNKTCLAQVYAQTDLQAFYGFTTDAQSQFNDMPKAEPSFKSTTNRYVANITNLSPGARVYNIEFYDMFNYTMFDSQILRYRQNCAYSVYSDPFTCWQNGFSMIITGHDENGFLFNRNEYGVCLGAGGERTSMADFGMPMNFWPM